MGLLGVYLLMCCCVQALSVQPEGEQGDSESKLAGSMSGCINWWLVRLTV